MKKLILILGLLISAPLIVQAEDREVNQIEFYSGSGFLGIGDGKPGVFGIGTGQNLSSKNYNRWIQKRREFRGFKKIRLPDQFQKAKGKNKTARK